MRKSETNLPDLDPHEIIKFGILYNPRTEKSLWRERKVYLCGEFLYQYSGKNVFEGKFNITECSIEIIDRSAGTMPSGYYGFILKNRDKHIVYCSKTEDELSLWVTAITNQVSDKKKKESCCMHFATFTW